MTAVRGLARLVVLLSLGACAGPTMRETPLSGDFEVVTSVEDGSGHALADRVWGLRPTDELPPVEPVAAAAAQRREAPPQDPGAKTGPQQPGEQEQEGEEQDKQELGPGEKAAIRSRFGSNVIIGADGRVTKQYYLTGESGPVFLNLLVEPGKTARDKQGRPAAPEGPARVGGAAESQSILAQMLGDYEVEIVYFDNFERPEGVTIRDPAGKPVITGRPETPQPGAPSALVLATSEPEGLAAFEGALNLFFASIPQVEIEVKVVEYSTVDNVSFGISQVDSKTPTLTQLSAKKLVKSITSQFPLTAPLIGGAARISDRGTITLGGIHDSWELNAQLEALEANNVADILSSPKMVVRNGGMASVSTLTEIPYPKAKITSSGQNITSDIQFKQVGITLNIRPVIAGTKTVILQVYASVSAVTGFAATEPVQTPIISTREAVTSVHVTDGKTSVIGGLVSKSIFEQEQKFPILGDIPVLGYLFRSSSTQRSETTLEFHITPRIIQGAQGFAAGGPIGG